MKPLPTFKLTEQEEPSGGFQGETPRMTYHEIVEIFGRPQYSFTDDPHAYKVSTQWNIQFSDGTMASIYDYKMTALYEIELPSPQKFRRMRVNWHIGGDVDFHIGRVESQASHLVLATICLHWPYKKLLDIIKEIDDNPDPMLEFGITTPITVEKMLAAAARAGKRLHR